MVAYQPPAHSPLGLGDVRAAIAGSLLGRGRAAAEDHLRAILADHYHAEEVVLCASGTQALQLAIRLAADRSPGASPEGVVALPAYTCFDIASAAVGADVKVLFYDVDPETLSPDLESVARALEQGAGTVVVTPLYGIPIDWDGIEALTRSRGAVLIEDAAQSVGARWQGRRLGGLGELSVLSFGRGKGWTGGGGGALLLRGEAARPLPEELLGPRPGIREEIRRAVLTTAQWGLGRPGLYGIPARIPGLGLGETVYQTPRPVARMPHFSAVLAGRTAEVAESESVIRRAQVLVMEDRLARLQETGRLRLITPVFGGTPGYLRLPLLLKGGLHGLARLPWAERLGIRAGYPAILPHLPVLDPRVLEPSGPLPGATCLVQELITLPVHRFVSPKVSAAIVAELSRLP
jgi:perosamine synthetase